MNQQALDMLGWVFVVGSALFGAFLVVYCIYLLHLHRLLAAVHEQNREMRPAMVWLMLVPLLRTFFSPYMVARIADSLHNEFDDRRWTTDKEGFGWSAGMLAAWGGVANFVLRVLTGVCPGLADLAALLNILGLVLTLPIFVCWIIYWIQTHGYKVRLREGIRGYRPGSIEEDYDDSFRPRRTREEYEENEEQRHRPQSGFKWRPSDDDELDNWGEDQK